MGIESFETMKSELDDLIVKTSVIASLQSAGMNHLPKFKTTAEESKILYAKILNYLGLLAKNSLVVEFASICVELEENLKENKKLGDK